MQWGQIKVLFILSFLVLDLFLLQQFLSKQDETELGQISTEAEDVETELENSGVTIAADALPSETPSVAGLKSSDNKFSEEMLTQMEEIDDSEQEVEIIENDVVKVTMAEPVEVTEDNIMDKVNQLVPFGSQYSFWDWNKDEDVALFFQKARDRTVYFNKGGYLLVHIHEDEIVSYVASMLSFSDSEEVDQSDDLISALSAIKSLLELGQIKPGDEVTSMNIGYHSSINLAPGEENGPQVFAPTWKVTVNGEDNHYLYALTGTLIEIDEADFITDIVAEYDLKQPEASEEFLNEGNRVNETN